MRSTRLPSMKAADALRKIAPLITVSRSYGQRFDFLFLVCSPLPERETLEGDHGEEDLELRRLRGASGRDGAGADRLQRRLGADRGPRSQPAADRRRRVDVGRYGDHER